MDSTELKQKIEAIGGVTPVSAEEKEAIKRNTAYALPNSPAEHGMPADAVKLAFWRGIVGDSNSAIASLNRIASECVSLKSLRAFLVSLVEAIENNLSKLETDLEGQISSKLGKNLEADPFESLYGVDSDGTPVMYRFSEDADGGTLAMRQSNGVLAVGDTYDDWSDDNAVNMRSLKCFIEALPDAVADEQRGFMTAEQAGQLHNLCKLFEMDEDNLINTIQEVLDAFASCPEGMDVAKVLAGKLSTAHANDEHAHAALFSLFDEKISAEETERKEKDESLRSYADDKIVGEKTERVAADSALSKRLDSIPDASTTKRGYMTPTQVKLLKNIVALHGAEDFLTDDAVAYRKVIPVKALPYATLGKIGGNVKIRSSNMLAKYGRFRVGVFDGNYATISVDETDPTLITVTAAPPTEYDPNDDPPRASASAEFCVMTLPEGTYTLHGVPSEYGIAVSVNGADTFVCDSGEMTFYHSYAHEELMFRVACDATKSFSVSFKIELNEGDTAYATTTTCVTAPVTEVVSGNSNLFDIDNPRLVGITTGTITANSPVISDGLIYSGGVHGGSRGAGLLVDVKNIDTIYISFNYAYDSSVNRYAAMLVDFFNEIDDDIYNPEREDSFAFSNAEGYVSRAVDVSGYDFVSLMFCSTVRYGIAITDLMVSVEDVPYEPYGVLDTYTIPAEIRALKGYGEGNPYNPAEVNYIDIEARKFVAYGYMDEPDADYPDVKVWVPYDAPVETDISAYLPEDNFIRVARGGTLTFVNEHEVAVPSTVTYQQEVGE